MTQHDASSTTSGDAPPRARYRGRHLPMVAVVVAAFIATALAYSGMVLFGLEVANMEPLEAYALAGFLEVSLVAVALMARNAALEGRPYGVLLTLTWVLSGTSGVFAALHEVAVPTASTPYMVVFRFVPPLVAALMWHLALVGERHMVTGHTLDERRRERRVHQYVTALELWRDARLDSSGDRRGAQKVRGAHERQRAARDRALKLLTVEDFERRMQVWVERLEAAERHGSRLDQIGASAVKRGTARGVVGWSDEPEPARATDPIMPAAPVVPGAPTGPLDVLGGQPYEPETAFEALPDFEARVKEAFGTPAPLTAPEPLAPAGSDDVPAAEPLPETGRTPAEAPTVARDRRIVELAREGKTQREIADDVAASRSTVSRVVRRYEDQKNERGLEFSPA